MLNLVDRLFDDNWFWKFFLNKNTHPGSKERKELEASIAKFSAQTEDVPIIIGGKEYRTDNVQYQPMPHDHKNKVAKFYWATPELVQKSIDTALAAKVRLIHTPVIQLFNIKIYTK